VKTAHGGSQLFRGTAGLVKAAPSDKPETDWDLDISADRHRMTDRALVVMTGTVLEKCLEIARLTRRRLGVVLPAKNAPGRLFVTFVSNREGPALPSLVSQWRY